MKILFDQPIVDQAGDAKSVLREQYKLSADYPANFSTVFKACVELDYIKLNAKQGKTYGIEITAIGKRFLKDNLRFLPAERDGKKLSVKSESQSYPVQETIIESRPEKEPDEIEKAEEFIESFKALVAKAKGYDVIAKMLEGTKADFVSLLGENSDLRDQIKSQKSQLVDWERRYQNLIEENKTLRKKMSTGNSPTAKSLRASDLPKLWQELAKKALAQGWHITFTNANHIRWVSPSGEVYISSNTPSDSRATANLKAALVKRGLRLK